MSGKRYAIQLTTEEREQLNRLVRGGKHAARILTRARVLLKLDEGWNVPQIASALDVSDGTVFRIKRRYAAEGLDAVLHDRVQANRFRKLDDKAEAHLIALACSDAPEGHDHWTLQLLADRMVELDVVESLSYETVRLKLKKRPQALAQAAMVHSQGRRGVCGGPVSGTGQAMEDVLDLYAEPYDAQRPVLCFDETSTQLLSDVREPLPPQPGRPRRQDYEYRRAGTRNIFLTCEPRAGWRHVAITERRTMPDFAHQMQWLVDTAYPDAPVIRVVLDNPVSSTGQALNIHRMASLYETFPAAEARRIVKRLEFHHTPKHAIWLNPVLSLPKGWRKSNSAS